LMILLPLVHQKFSLYPSCGKTKGEMLIKTIPCVTSVNEESQAMRLVYIPVSTDQQILHQLHENFSPLDYQGIFL